MLLELIANVNCLPSYSNAIISSLIDKNDYISVKEVLVSLDFI